MGGELLFLRIMAFLGWGRGRLVLCLFRTCILDILKDSRCTLACAQLPANGMKDLDL